MHPPSSFDREEPPIRAGLPSRGGSLFTALAAAAPPGLGGGRFFVKRVARRCRVGSNDAALASCCPRLPCRCSPDSCQVKSSPASWWPIARTGLVFASAPPPSHPPTKKPWCPPTIGSSTRPAAQANQSYHTTQPSPPTRVYKVLPVSVPPTLSTPPPPSLSLPASFVHPRLHLSHPVSSHTLTHTHTILDHSPSVLIEGAHNNSTARIGSVNPRTIFYPSILA